MGGLSSIVVASSAELSDCGRYRYALERRLWGELLPGQDGIAFIGLNPSTADAEQDDATIRRCIGFTARWGYPSFVMLNLFAWRSRDPRAISRVVDPEGPRNNERILYHARRAARVICCWGAFRAPIIAQRAAFVRELLSQGQMLYHLGLTNEGHPRHPLYVPNDTAEQEWRQPTGATP